VTRSSRASGGLPKRHSSTTCRSAVCSKRVCFVVGEGKLLKSGSSSWPAVCVEKRARRSPHPLHEPQELPPPYPGGSAERRACLEGTKKDSTASGVSSWTAAAHEAGTHRTPYCQMCKKKPLVVHVRDQVVIARPPVLTPPWCYRRSLVSKGRFAAMPINAICVGICSSLPKR
jgi:hypothetical protein